MALTLAGRYRDAVVTLEEAIGIDGDEAYDWAFLALAKYELDPKSDWAAAWACAEEKFDADPDTFDGDALRDEVSQRLPLPQKNGD